MSGLPQTLHLFMLCVVYVDVSLSACMFITFTSLLTRQRPSLAALQPHARGPDACLVFARVSATSTTRDLCSPSGGLSRYGQSA